MPKPLTFFCLASKKKVTSSNYRFKIKKVRGREVKFAVAKDKKCSHEMWRIVSNK